MRLDAGTVMMAGDWHGQSLWATKAITYAAQHGADVIVHVGDFGLWVDNYQTDLYLLHVQRALAECGIELWFVDGNHEDHSRLVGKNDPGCQPWRVTDNIWHLPRGFRWELWGLVWMALGGAHSVDKPVRVRENLGWWPEEVLTEAQVEYACRPGKVDVIVAHDCPSGVDIPGIGPPVPNHPFWSFEQLVLAEAHRYLVRKVVDATRPALFVHGHYHTYYTSEYRGDDFRTVIAGLDMNDTSLRENTLFLDDSTRKALSA